MSKFCNYLIIVLFVLFLTDLSLTDSSNFIQNKNKTSLLCKDGKGPLLEGEERVFQCFDNNCPAGFQCENNNGNGILLYNEASAEIKRESNEQQINREQLNNEQLNTKIINNFITFSNNSQNHFQNNPQSVRDSPVALEEIKKQQLLRQIFGNQKIYFLKNLILMQVEKNLVVKDNPIAADRTIRTLKECEALCTDKLDKYIIKEEQPNLQISGIVRLMEKEEKEKINKKEFNENNNILITSTLQAINIDIENEKNNLQSESYKIMANSSIFHYPQNNPIKVPPSSASAELAEFLLSEQRPHSKSKRCEKITPYRTICPSNGLTSQFTLRWYQRGENCFAYPYGYCNDLIFNEEPIKTEKECLLICVQRREDGGGWMSRRKRLLK
uniref:BPTI/Kunitz inhibitor domain-containing protein n=1 Tax=Meloidogyne hapla TaxID=6305 RepID=A0A1I8BBC6_MELHA